MNGFKLGGKEQYNLVLMSFEQVILISVEFLSLVVRRLASSVWSSEMFLPFLPVERLFFVCAVMSRSRIVLWGFRSSFEQRFVGSLDIRWFT
ncbi:hypothetical protein V6N13_125691 [Hibiscus sabdariffa]